MEGARVEFVHRLEPEDQARADFYAMLARLYHAAPDATLLATIAAAGDLRAPEETEAAEAAEATEAKQANDAGSEFARAWHMLIAASAAMDADAAAAEYQELFVGVGRSEVSLYASQYVRSLRGSALADVRATLARLGFSRKTGVNVYEDHLAAVCETMRLLIAGSGEVKPCTFAQQREFFEAHVSTWVFDCCTAIKQTAIANYYRRVAEFTDSFMVIERDSFAIE